MNTVKCITKGCRNRITPPHRHNNWDLWCGTCHAVARGEDKMTAAQFKERAKQKSLQRIFRDGRLGKICRYL
jgi:hypothetical protein